jgi:hypothetical protein
VAVVSSGNAIVAVWVSTAGGEAIQPWKLADGLMGNPVHASLVVPADVLPMREGKVRPAREGEEVKQGEARRLFLRSAREVQVPPPTAAALPPAKFSWKDRCCRHLFIADSQPTSNAGTSEWAERRADKDVEGSRMNSRCDAWMDWAAAARGVIVQQRFHGRGNNGWRETW